MEQMITEDYNRWLNGWFGAMRGAQEYYSWAPQSFWDAQDPALVEYNSWGLGGDNDA